MHRPAFRLATLLFVAIAPLSGCAFTNIPITMPTSGLENTVPGGAGRHVVVSIPFRDDREIRDRCGMQKNGYNMDTADAVCQSNPNAWIAQLLADELRASGFTVLREGDEARRSSLQVEGSLMKLFIEPIIGAWSGSLEADLAVVLRLSTETGLRAERSFAVKGWKGGMMVSTAQPYHTALHRGTQALLEEMVRAIIELADAYPELGSLDGDHPMHIALELAHR